MNPRTRSAQEAELRRELKEIGETLIKLDEILDKLLEDMVKGAGIGATIGFAVVVPFVFSGSMTIQDLLNGPLGGAILGAISGFGVGSVKLVANSIFSIFNNNVPIQPAQHIPVKTSAPSLN